MAVPFAQTSPGTSIATIAAVPAVAPVSDETLLFKEALDEVEHEHKDHSKSSGFFDVIRHFDSIEEVEKHLFTEKEKNVKLVRLLSGKWPVFFQRLARSILQYKDILSGLSQINQMIGSPIWGVCSFILNMLNDIGGISDSLEDFFERSENLRTRVKEDYLKNGRAVPDGLRKPLKRYFKTILKFSVGVHQDFVASSSLTLGKLIQGTMKTKLDDLLSKLQGIIYDVDQAGQLPARAQIDRLVQYHSKMLNAQQTAPSATHSTRGVSVGLNLRCPSFTGRTKQLAQIENILSQSSSASTSNRAVLVGMGGIGKSQIIRKYAEDHLRTDNRPKGYDAVAFIDSHDSSSIQTGVQSFLELVSNGDPTIDTNGRLEISFSAWLARHENWLVTFDNVKELSAVKPFLPSSHSGHVICSTRHHLLAQQITDDDHILEISGMESDESSDLVKNLARQHSTKLDINAQSIDEVVQFANGLPLLIEQIVHNAIRGGETLTKTLQSLQKNRALLYQKNEFSAHENLLNMGAAVLQTMEWLSKTSPEGSRLFEILLFMQPSCIPFSMVRAGLGELERYLDRDCTYDRGPVDYVKARPYERLDGPRKPPPKSSFFEEADPFKPSSIRDALKKRWNRNLTQDGNPPVDDGHVMLSLRNFCKADKGLSNLLAGEGSMKEAMIQVRDSGAVRLLDNGDYWMHDLISELGQILSADRSGENAQQLALLPAIMVYLAFPVPGQHQMRGRGIACERYLPHAIECHGKLKDLGLLNNISAGPELSHIIASTIFEYGSPESSTSGSLLSAEYRQKRRQEVLKYYHQAYVGYTAGWKRLLQIPGVTRESVAIATFFDMEKEKYLPRFGNGWGPTYHAWTSQRFGRHAPWRAVQTLLRIAYLLQDEPSGAEAAISYLSTALRYYETILGKVHTATRELRLMLLVHMTRYASLWEEAYDVSCQGLQDLTGWAGDMSELAPAKENHVRDTMISDGRCGIFLQYCGQSCMEQSKKATQADDATLARDMARKAIVFCQIEMEQNWWVWGQMAITSIEAGWRLAEAYELADDKYTSLACYAKTIEDAMSVSQGLEGDFKMPAETVLEIAERFESAKVRLLPSLLDHKGFRKLNASIKASDHALGLWRLEQELADVEDLESTQCEE